MNTSWSKDRLLNDPRIENLIIRGIIGSNATKQQLVDAWRTSQRSIKSPIKTGHFTRAQARKAIREVIAEREDNNV